MADIYMEAPGGSGKKLDTGVAESCTLQGGNLFLQKIPEGRYAAAASDAATPKVYVDQAKVATAIGLTAAMLKPGETLLGVTGAVVEFARNFDYNGNVQAFVAPYTGYYKLVGYGAQGGTGGNSEWNIRGYGGTGGYGGYVEAVALLQQNDSVSVYVGGMGKTGEIGAHSGTGGAGGYNDGNVGGKASDSGSCGGGGGGGGSTRFIRANVLLCSADGGGGGSGGCYVYNQRGDSGAGGRGGGSNGGAGAVSTSLTSSSWANKDGTGGAGGSFTLNTEQLTLYKGATGQRSGNGSASVTYVGKTPYG